MTVAVAHEDVRDRSQGASGERPGIVRVGPADQLVRGIQKLGRDRRIDGTTGPSARHRGGHVRVTDGVEHDRCEADRSEADRSEADRSEADRGEASRLPGVLRGCGRRRGEGDRRRVVVRRGATPRRHTSSPDRPGGEPLPSNPSNAHRTDWQTACGSRDRPAKSSPTSHNDLSGRLTGR